LVEPALQQAGRRAAWLPGDRRTLMAIRCSTQGHRRSLAVCRRSPKRVARFPSGEAAGDPADDVAALDDVMTSVAP
jgi:hypothetical protein